MNAANVLFYFFVLMAALGAVAILFSTNVFKAALCLLVTLLSVAALFALTFAEFLAVTQILIYAGGITVIIIFGIMLTTRVTGRPLEVRNAHIVSGGIVGIALFILLTQYASAIAITEQALAAESISFIALKIFSVYTLPFEVAGLLLLIALIGAAVTTSKFKSGN